MKKIYLILFSLLTMFSLTLKINALGVVGDGNNSQPIGGAVNTTQNWIPGLSKWKIQVGIRISFVKNTGQDIKTIDYILQNADHSSAYIQYAGGHSKVHYAKGYDKINFTTGGNNLTISSTSDIYEKFNKYKFNLAFDKYVKADWKQNGETKKLTYAYNVSLASNWFLKSSNGGNYYGPDTEYEENLKGLLKELLGEDVIKENKIDVDNDESLKNIFMVVEPTALINLTQTTQPGYYYGTAYELAMVSYHSAYENNFPNGSYGTRGLTSFATALGRNIPCSSVLDGSINTTMSTLNVNVGWSESNKYFDIITIKSDACNIEGNKVLDEEIVVGDYGVGMAVVWFYGLIPGKNTPSCDDINTLLRVNPKEISCDNSTWFKQTVNNFNNIAAENEFNNITVDWYSQNCGCKPNNDGYNCKPIYYADTCIDSQYTSSIYYKDSSEGIVDEEYWENCVFSDSGKYGDMMYHKTSAPGELSYLDSSLGSETYCPVYCIEEVSADFDKSYTSSVTAGNHFVWPSANRTTISSSRTCKTNMPNDAWKTFENRISSANAAIKEAYELWQLETLKPNAIKNATSETDGCTKCKKYDWVESPNYGGTCNITTKKTGEVVQDRCTPLNCAALEHIGTTENINIRNNYRCITSYSKKYECVEEEKTTKYTASAEFGEEEWSSSWCEGNSAPSYNINTAKSIYESSLTTPIGIINEMNKCYGLTESNVINSQSELSIQYTQGGYDYIGTLVPTTIEQDSNSNHDCVDADVTVYTGCSGETKCSTTTKTVKKCTSVEKTNYETNAYNLDSSVYRYVLKEDNKSIHASEITKYKGQDYNNIGYGNLPVSYSTEIGTKDGLSISYLKIGNLESSDTTATDIDKILSSVENENYGNWQCNYTVNKGIVDDGLKVIYRTIDLNNPFPDIDGKGRKTGSNWCSNYDCSNTNSVVKSVILDKKDILKQEPMYSFILTPTTIKQIRNYNKSVSEGYLDFNLDCEEATGKACISRFLTEYKGLMQSGGTCFETGIRAPKSSSFYRCKN